MTDDLRKHLSDVQNVYACQNAFAAHMKNKMVVIWGGEQCVSSYIGDERNIWINVTKVTPTETGFWGITMTGATLKWPPVKGFRPVSWPPLTNEQEAERRREYNCHK